MQIVPFLLFAVLGSYTPGPNNIMAMNSARLHGFAKSRPFMMGMSSGFALIVFMSANFNIYLAKFMPFISPYLGVIGACYMMWLAIKPFIASKSGGLKTEEKAGSYLTGLALQLINPKVIFYSLTITASFITPYYSSQAALLFFSVGIGLLGFSSLCCWGLFGVVFQRYFSNHERALNIVMALLLTYCAWSVLGVK